MRSLQLMGMPKPPISIEMVQEGEERFIVKTFADGSEQRVPMVSTASI